MRQLAALGVVLSLACHGGGVYGPGTACDDRSPCRFPLACVEGRCQPVDGSPAVDGPSDDGPSSIDSEASVDAADAGPDVTPDTSDDAFDAGPDVRLGASDDAADAGPDIAPHVSDDAAPDTGPRVTPHTSDDAADTGPRVTPHTSDDAAPDVRLDTSDDAADAGPDVRPDANNDAAEAGPDGGTPSPPCPAGRYRNVVRNVCIPTGDLNGDGKADLLSVNWREHHALISDGSRFTFKKWFDAPFYGVEGALAADVTGDGYADGIAYGHTFVGVVSNGSAGFGTIPENFYSWSTTGLLGSKATLLADVDGDAKADTIAIFDHEMSVALSDGTRFVTPTSWATGNFTDLVRIFAADVDGDGMSDVIGIRPAAVAVWLSTGSTFRPEVIWRPSGFAGNVWTFFADVDGDGRADGVRLDDNAVWIARSTGGAFADVERWFNGRIHGSFATYVADANGDGQADVISANTASIEVALSRGNEFGPLKTWFEGDFSGEVYVTPAPMATLSFAAARATTVGVFRPANQWLLRTGRSLDADVELQFGEAGDIPVSGDWDGDGVATIGVVHRENDGRLRWLLRNSASAGPPEINVVFGSQAVGDVPITGDWDGDGKTTIGVVHREAGDNALRWMLLNSMSTGPADLDFRFGSVGTNDFPVAGDWDGNGTTTIGFFRPATGEWFLRNSNDAGGSDAFRSYGDAFDLPVVGDWDGNGTTTIGVFRPAGTPMNPGSQPQWLLRNEVSSGPPEIIFSFGVAGDRPVTGKWSSRP